MSDINDLSQKLTDLHMVIKDNHSEVQTSLTKIDCNMTSLSEKVEEHEEKLEGNGKDGLILKVDRMEQNDARRTWHFRTIWVAIVAVCGRIAYKIFN